MSKGLQSVATSADRHRIVVSVFFAEDLRLVTRPSPPAPLAVCACLIFFNLEPDFCIPLLTRGPLTSSLPSHVPLTGPKSTAPACPGVRRERARTDRHNTSERKHSMRNMHGYFVPAKTVRRPRRPNSQGCRLVAHRVDISMSALAARS